MVWEGFGRNDHIDLEVLFVYLFSLFTSTYIDVAKWMLLSSPIDVFAFKVCSFVAQGYKITNLTSKKGCDIYSGTEHCAPADCFLHWSESVCRMRLTRRPRKNHHLH